MTGPRIALLPLRAAARDALASLRAGPRPTLQLNPGVVDRLCRGGLADLVWLPSPYASHRGRTIQHIRITDDGRKEVSSWEKPS